jgi:HSP20 family protein
MFADIFSPMPALPIDRLMNDLVRYFNRSASATGTIFPLHVDTQADQVTLTAFAPGCSAKDLTIEVEGNEVTITGRRDVAVGQDGVTWHRRERSSSAWTRSVALPVPIEADSAFAELAHGVLTLNLKRPAETRPRMIGITDRSAGEAP